MVAKLLIGFVLAAYAGVFIYAMWLGWTNEDTCP